MTVQASGLVKHFAADIRAVDGIDLYIGQGEVFALLGANGSGKTTTVRMLTTLLKPTGGTAEIDGLDVVRHPSEVRRRIGVALQEISLDDLQTGRELLTLQARLYNVPGDSVRRRVDDLLAIVEMSDAADRSIKTYSGGMKRRLDLAAALVHSPKTIFLDEPTTGLDPISRETIWCYVRSLNSEEGVTFFLTTQYLEEADRLADRVAIMSAGKIVGEGSPAELKASIGTDVITVEVEGGPDEVRAAAAAVGRIPGLEDTELVNQTLVLYIREGASAVARIVLALDEANLKVGEVRLTHPTLDDVFLRKTGHHIEPEVEGSGERRGNRRP